MDNPSENNSPCSVFQGLFRKNLVQLRLREWDPGVHTCMGAECFSSRRPLSSEVWMRSQFLQNPVRTSLMHESSSLCKTKVGEFAQVVALTRAILQFVVSRMGWAALVEQSSLSDEPESVLVGQESGATSSCQSAAPRLVKILLSRDESRDVGSLHIRSDCTCTCLLQANTCCCNYGHVNLVSFQTTSPLCTTLPWRELFLEPLRWTGLFPSLSGRKKNCWHVWWRICNHNPGGQSVLCWGTNLACCCGREGPLKRCNAVFGRRLTQPGH